MRVKVLFPCAMQCCGMYVCSSTYLPQPTHKHTNRHNLMHMHTHTHMTHPHMTHTYDTHSLQGCSDGKKCYVRVAPNLY